MRTDTKPRPTEQGCSFETFLTVLNNPAPVFAVTPRTLRAHIGSREFGDFGAVLMADRPASADLSKRVERWRRADATAREDLPLYAYPERTAEDCLPNWLVAGVPIAILIWILIGLIAAWMKGVI